MNTQLNIVVRGMTRTPEMDGIVQERLGELDLLDPKITECRVLIERTRKYLQSGNPFRVVINLRFHSAPGIIVKQEPSSLIIREPLPTALRNAFAILKRKMIGMQRRKDRPRIRPQAEYGAVVSRIFREKGYGFLRTDSGRSIFFHRNSVVGDEFDLMEEGVGVWFIEREGEKGPWASTVRICASAS